jgi:hypothetical protein
MAPALHTASDTARIAFAPSFLSVQHHIKGNYQYGHWASRILYARLKTIVPQYLLFAPAPLVGGSIKLLDHEVINVNLLSWILQHTTHH